MTLDEFIAEAAHSTPNVEACGFVFRDQGGALFADRRENKAPDQSKNFLMDAAEFVQAKSGGELVGYWHSHPDTSCAPSDADKTIAEAVGLPCWIYSVPDKQLACYNPTGWRAPLEGRDFVPHVYDCVSLVWDYYAEQGLELPALPRTESEFNHGIKFDWRKICEAVGATIHPQLPAPQIGDVFVMIIGESRKPNHLGVYVGAGQMLHQTSNAKSCRVPWAGYWKKHTVFTIRRNG